MTIVRGLNFGKILERLLSEEISLEDVYKMNQPKELAIADVVHIKNKDMENLHKMGATKQILVEIKKGKKLCFGFGEKRFERCVQCPGWRKSCFKSQKNNYFSRQCKNKQRESLSHYTKEQIHTIYPYI